ncbi:MAG: DUF1559 domain-containing protein [Armatimonadia bacterium]
MGSKRGFTLIELLVVIAIIAILAAILFPVFAKAREKARQSSCLSNTKQISIGILSYTQDYDECLPYGQMDYAAGSAYIIANIPSTTNPSAIVPYLKNTQIAKCPSLAGASYGYGWSYNHMPYRSGTTTIYTPASLGTFNYPSEVMMFADSQDGTGARAYVYCPIHQSTIDGGRGYVGERHNDGANVAFLDGHSKWLSKSVMRKTDAAGQRLWYCTN